MSCALHARLMVVIVATWMAASCGGGGGGGGSGGGGGNNGGGSSTSTDPTLSIDTRTFSVTATAWDQGQSRVARLTVQNLPSGGAWVFIDGTDNGVGYVDFFAESATAAQLILEFRPGAQVMPGTYRDTITVSVCADEQCATQFRNSPITLSTTLVVAGGESSIASLDGPVSATISKRSPPPTLPVDSTTATVGSPGPIAPHIALANPSALLQGVVAVMESTSRVRLDTTFNSAFGLQRGEHTETVMLKACYDSSCLRQLAGSPFSLPVTYLVTDDVPPEPGVEPLPYLSRMALAHDVIDSEYSPQLHGIVMVSTYPRNSLYLFDLVTQDEREIALNKPPKSVSIAPDGTHAAVGHDALVSVVDLGQLRQTGTATPLLLNISTVAFDIVMDGRGYVHVFPEYDQWVNLHTVEIATNTETLSTGGSVRAGTRGRLHPSGDYMYGADNGLSPSDIEKYDIRGGTAVMLYDSPYHGDHGMCGNVWMSEEGNTLYTPCGNTFTSSTTQAQDMVYSGKLELSKNQYYSFLITSLSHSSESKEIALIETDNSCFGDDSTCYSHLAIYESDFLNRQSVHSIAPIRVAGSDYAQRGLFVFHSADGQHRYMISRLLDVQDPDSEFYLTVVN